MKKLEAKTYIVPVSYTVSGCIAVTAVSEEDALNAAEEHIDDLPLLDDTEYIDGSYEVETEGDMVSYFTEMYEKREITATRSDVVSEAAKKAMEQAKTKGGVADEPVGA